jgi:hypothetical protein
MPKSAITYRGCISSKNSLPISGNTLGDYFLDKETGIQYYWSKNTAIGSLSDWKPLNVVEGVGTSQENIERSWMGF